MAILAFPDGDDAVPLPDRPPLLHYLLLHFYAPILAWLSDCVSQPLLRRCASHPLVRLARLYAPSTVVSACRAYYHSHRPGRPPTYTINTLVRAEIVRAWAGSCSEPQLECYLATNLVVRWYVGLPLGGPTPDQSTLNRFHAWLTIQSPDVLFRDVLAFLDQVDPEDPAATPQIVDTFAMASPLAPTASPARLLLHLSARLVTAWMQHVPDAQALLPPLELGPLAHPSVAPTALQRQAQLEQAVTVSTWLVTALRPGLPLLEPEAKPVIQPVLDALVKVIADETTTDGNGAVHECSRTDKGQDRIMSAVDLEATFRKHEPDPAVLGTTAMSATTTTRIRAAVIRTGSTPAQEAPVAVLKQQAAGAPLPPALIMDQAGGMGKPRAEVQTVSQGQTRMGAQVPHSCVDGSARFTPADFRVTGAGEACTCPNGVTSRHVYQHSHDEGVEFRFFGGECCGCELWERCRGPASKPTSQRSVSLSAYHAHQREAAAFTTSEEGKGLLRGRWQVEPTIAWLVRSNGCRQARRVGLAAAQCQLFQACAVRNLQLWLGRLERKQAPQPRQGGSVRGEVMLAA